MADKKVLEDAEATVRLLKSAELNLPKLANTLENTLRLARRMIFAVDHAERTLTVYANQRYGAYCSSNASMQEPAKVSLLVIKNCRKE